MLRSEASGEMRPVAPTVIGLVMGVSVAWADPPAKTVPAGVEQCMEQTRAANATCIDPANSTPNLVACFEAAAAARAECLTRSSKENPSQDVQAPAPASAWVVSETASPVDYSPMVTAVVRSRNTESGAPVSLTVRCREKRTGLWLRTDGLWQPSRGGDLQIEMQIDDQPPLRAQWSVSSDGRTAVFPGDAVRLLRSIPDLARVGIKVIDGGKPIEQTTFQLSGVNAVRQKIGDACGWEPQQGRQPQAPVGR